MSQYPPPGYYPPSPQMYGVPPYAPQTNGAAIFSLIAGIAAWTICPGLAAIAAIIAGHMAKGAIRDSGGMQTGGGMATAGLIMGYGQLVLTIIGVCIYAVMMLGIFGLAASGGGS